MDSTHTATHSSGQFLSLSAKLNRAETVEAAVAHALELSEAAFDRSVARVCAYDLDADTDAVTVIGSSGQSIGQAAGTPDEVPESVLGQMREGATDGVAETTPNAVVDTDPGGSLQTEVVAPVGHRRALRLGWTDTDGFDETGVPVVEGIAANLEATLSRLDGRETRSGGAERQTDDDATALRRLNELMVDSGDSDDTIERLLSLGCTYFGLDTGILSRVDGDDYEVEAVVDATGDHESGAVYDLEGTMCQATLAGDRTGPLAVADVSETDHRNHPAAESVCAYIAAPVVADGETYGTVNFSMGRPRAASFRPAEREFVTHVAEWIGSEIERRRRFDRLRRYETILEAVGDPVYALDPDGRFTFVNAAAKRAFGYGEEVVGEHVSVGMDKADVERVRGQIEALLETDERSTTVEFELQAEDGRRRIVENRLALTGDEAFRGTAGVLRDITARQERKRELESFQRAVEEAADGVAILDDEEYVYVDQTHLEMYGFDVAEDLLGETWRTLYDDEEIARLEEEAFPALEADGHWRGMVTGSRPDGSTFPAELSLTIVGDGRLVCTVRDETERKARERELELKERAMDEATVGIQITDATREGNPLVYVNDGFERMTGYASEDVLGRSPGFLREEDSESEEEEVTRLQAAFDAEEPVSLERESHRKDGSPYWSRLSVTPVTDEDGAVTNYVGIQQDVTERREQKQAADARVDLLERVYDVTTDPETGFEEKISGLLTAGRDYLDLPYGFLTRIETGDTPSDGTQTVLEATGSHDRLQPGESGPLSQSYCQRTVRQDEVVALTDAAESEFVSDAAHEAFGLETYVGGTVLVGDERYGTLCFASDERRGSSLDAFEQSFVSLLAQWAGYEIERRNAREELREQRERLELALTGTDTGLAEVDTVTGSIWVNETLVDVVGRDVESIDEFEEIVHPDDRKRVREQLNTVTETGDPWTDEFRVFDGEGEAMWLGTRAVVTGEDDDRRRVLATATDITERKREELERKRSVQRYQSLAENIPNGAVLTFDADLEYVLAAGELVSAFGLSESDITGQSVGTVLADGRHELIPRFRAALEGERTDRRIEVDDRVIRVHIVPANAAGVGQTAGRGLVLVQDVTEEAEREQELFEERERFRSLIESVEEYAFLTVGADGTIRTWNAGAERLFGYDAEAAVGTSLSALRPESDSEADSCQRLLQQARISGESAHEGWRLREDGSEFYADVRYTPLESDDGEFHCYAMVVRDMTDRRRQRRRTERFVEEAEDVVTVVDTEGTITYASGSANRILGYDPGDLVGENLFDYLHPESRESAMETFFTSIEDPDADRRAECRIRSSDGEWRNVEGQCRNMLDDDAIDGMLLYLRDVTEDRERARRFESIFNQTFQFTGLLDPDGTVVEVNDAALEFGGVEQHEIVGNSFSDASWWTHSETVRRDVREAVEQAAGGEFVRYETEVRGGDGLATIDFSVKPVTDEDGDVSLLVVEGRDITARQQHKRHLEVMQRVMRHNMRNDLTKMRGWTQMMCEETAAEKRAEQFEVVERVLDKWEAMTEKMKDIERVLQSQNEEWETTESASLVEDAVDPVRAEYDDATVRTAVSDAESVPLPAALLEAVRELVENAAKASEDATVEVELTRPGDDWVVISVRDDGPGLPEMEADVLETGEETPLNHGQGLGLWMVRTTVTQAGGDVSVESTADGTAVRLRLPSVRSTRTGGPVETGE